MGDWIGILVFLAIALFIVGGIVFAIWQERKRRKELGEIAESLGLEYMPDGNNQLLSHISDFALFNSGRSRKNTKVISGETDEVRIAIFDYQYTTGSGKNSHTHHQSVVALQSSKLMMPRFRMRPEGMFDKLGSLVGANDIDFDSHPNFSRMFVLKGDDEEAIRKFFTNDLLNFFEDYTGYSVEGRDGALILYRPGKRIKPAEIKDYLAKAYEVFGYVADRASV